MNFVEPAKRPNHKNETHRVIQARYYYYDYCWRGDYVNDLRRALLDRVSLAGIDPRRSILNQAERH